MTDAWPKYIRVKYPGDPTGPGVRLQIFAPLNPEYESSQIGWLLGNQGMLDVSVADPSNGMYCNPPQPLRSPAGFPLVYARGAGNAPVGAPHVSFGDQIYASDAELLAWLQRRPGYEASLLAPKEVWTAVSALLSTPDHNPPKEPDPVDMATYQALVGNREKADFLGQHYELLSKVQREWPSGGENFAQWAGKAVFAPYIS